MTPADRQIPRVRRGAYLLPSAFTIGNMLLGFYAVVLGIRGAFQGAPGAFGTAALVVFAAAVLDTLDGRIARLTGSDSAFGREYDSLADVATFGMVPALLAYLWGLSELSRVGWLVPLFYFVCTATRLARFNVQTTVGSDRWFVGLPSPAAAGAVCSVLFLVPDSEWRSWLNLALLGILVLVGALEVSTFRYWNPKQIHFRARRSYRAVLPLAVVILLIIWNPRVFFAVFAAIYTVSGPIGWVVRRLRNPDGEEQPEGAEERRESPT